MSIVYLIYLLVASLPSTISTVPTGSTEKILGDILQNDKQMPFQYRGLWPYRFSQVAAKSTSLNSLKLPFLRFVLQGLAADEKFALRHRFEDYANIYFKGVHFWEKRSRLFKQ